MSHDRRHDGPLRRIMAIDLIRFESLGESLRPSQSPGFGITHSYDEQLDLEIVGRLPLSENLQYPLLGILVLHRRPLRTFGPADHVLHRYPPLFELKSPARLLEQQPCTRLGFVDKSAHGAELPIRH